MPVLSFDMNTANYPSRRHEFRGANKADYYDGDFAPLSSHTVDMRIERSLAGSYGIYRLVSRTPLGFRRTWTHIRNDRTNVTVVWFLRRGQMTVSSPTGRHIVGPRQCAITRSSKPFYMELSPDEGGVLEATHVIVPGYKLTALIGENIEIGRPFSTAGGDLLIAERALSLLFDEGDRVDPEHAEQLVEGLLTGLGRAMSRETGVSMLRCSIGDRRVAAITDYIGQHFGDPDLDARTVAKACGISLRYLCHVLQRSGFAFSTIVWDARMASARAALIDPEMQHYTIAEVSYQVGFKSSAHFSRMFKDRHGVSPSVFRAQQAIPGSRRAA